MQSKPTPKTNNDNDKCNKLKAESNNLIIFSANANSIKNKMDSLKFNIDLLNLHVIIIQETKLKNKSIKIDGYRCFATVRGDCGGGILIACKSSLVPVLIFEGTSECEVLVVQIKINDNLCIRIIAGYGAQECAPPVVREAYRNSIEEQVSRAKLSGCMIVIAEDANAKLGPELIPGDPHPRSENGKLLASMIERQNLKIVNASDKCTGGPITWQRTVNNKVENSCIDFLLVSKELESQLKEAIIDKDQLYALTKFSTTKGNPDIKRSDHYSLIAKFEVELKAEIKRREEIFKLRDAEGLLKFQTMTTKCNSIKQCIDETSDLETACNKWFKEVKRIMHQCFAKIKITSKPPKSTVDFEIYECLLKLKNMKEKKALAHDMMEPIVEREIMWFERELSVLQGNKCKKLIYEDMSHLMKDGSFSINDAWKLKKKMYPLSADAPFAIFDRNDNLVTEYDSILDVMKEEFQFRLRNREINQEYAELQEIKEYLCQIRLRITKTSNYDKWTMKQLRAAIQKLKNNKCKDPHGHINELYKNMGEDALISLLNLMNRIKEELIIPNKLNLSNVSTLYKGKGSKQNVINLRGIFKLPIVRNILDRLVCFDEQETVAENMGYFQVGNQKRRNIRDHTLIVHAVINETNIKKKKIDIQFSDIKQCFDSIWLDEATNDLYDSGIRSRNLNILYEGNRKTRMCVETNFGRSSRVELGKVVMQGSVTGGMFCSNQISKLCTKLHKEGDVYLYDDKVPIPALAMVDDIASIAECNSAQSLTTNIKTDTFIQRKKLEGQTGAGKCQWVHVGPDECRSRYKMNGETISQAETYKYLGDQVADDWEILYNKRWEKAQGYCATCLAMSTEISLGIQMFSFAKLLHASIFVNGSLVNMETWPNCTISRIEKFERTEQGYIRKLLNAHSKTPIECLYLELGIIPLRFQLMKRRILYLQDILNRNDDEITKRVVLRQKELCYKGDFYPQTKNDMDYLSVTEDDLSESKNKLIELLSKQINKKAFEYLINKASVTRKSMK